MRSVAAMAIKRAFLITFVAVVLALVAGSGAQAQENPDYTAPAPTVVVTSPPVNNISSTPAAQSGATPLALTGTDAIQLVVAGAVLLGGGAGLLAVRRRTAA